MSRPLLDPILYITDSIVNNLGSQTVVVPCIQCDRRALFITEVDVYVVTAEFLRASQTSAANACRVYRGSA
jgi:hypothetical protein